MAEFTGERLVPGQVEPDLWNEHVARYAFAAPLGAGRRVLDAGSGTGYGSAAMAAVASRVVGADIAREAVEFARANYSLANLSFEQASCEALPHPDASFDMIVSFEMIEHLSNWRAFLAEARRLLMPEGILLISTPNLLYYTESRGEAGANPFHVHEFTFGEFQAELRNVFPEVAMYLQNHAECIAFQSCQGNGTTAHAEPGEAAPDEAHFFLAVCSLSKPMPSPSFVYLPRMANVLRERERHIGLLNRQIEELRAERRRLAGLFDEQQQALDRSNAWAEKLNRDLEEGRARVADLQRELAGEQQSAGEMAAGYEKQVAKVTGELKKAQEWGQRLDKELEDCLKSVSGLDGDVQRLRQQLEILRSSRWIKLGRTVGLVPRI